jgi:hypothetical protein
LASKYTVMERRYIEAGHKIVPLMAVLTDSWSLFITFTLKYPLYSDISYWTGWSRGNTFRLVPRDAEFKPLPGHHQFWGSFVPLGKCWDVHLITPRLLSSKSFPILHLSLILLSDTI